MERDVLRKEIMWDYNCTSVEAISIINYYTNKGRYDDLCQMVMNKEPLPMKR